jgi:hypothetical protein
MPDDYSSRLDEDNFDYQVTKDNKVLIYWHNKHIKTLKGKHAHKFIAQIDGLDGAEEQLVLARVTGNFKRGNERDGKKRGR